MKDEFVVLKTGRNELTKVALNEILYFKADGDYTHIFMQSGEKYTISKNMKNTLADINSDMLIRINRSVAVNYTFITKVKTGKKPLVQMDHSEIFRPSKKYQNELKQIIAHTLNGSFHTMKGGVSHIYSSPSHIKENPDEM